MIITHTRGRGNKIHLHLDGEYKITTDVNFWCDNFIENKTEISEEEWAKLVSKINYKKAVNKCYDILSRRDHSVYELKTKLYKTVDRNDADKAVNRMIEYGYLNDERYAEKLFDYLLNTKKSSPYVIKQEMKKRGISNEIIEDIFCDVEIDNVKTITDLIKGKYANKLTQDNGREKVIGALMRKGFNYGDIKQAFDIIEDDESI